MNDHPCPLCGLDTCTAQWAFTYCDGVVIAPNKHVSEPMEEQLKLLARSALLTERYIVKEMCRPQSPECLAQRIRAGLSLFTTYANSRMELIDQELKDMEV